MLANCRIVLVRPHYPGNVGATARVMHNFGLRDLALVEPVDEWNSLESRRMAAHSQSILDSARIASTLDDALADCRVVLATSGKVAGLYRESSYGQPDEMLPRIVQALGDGPCALVFGPEPHGLSNAEIARCHGVIRIVTDPECPALNLAQAVAICTCELRHQWLLAQDTANVPARTIASFEEQERMFAHLKEALEAVHFLFGSKAEPLMHGLRQLIVRANPSPSEVRILHGLARQLLYFGRFGAGKTEDD